MEEGKDRNHIVVGYTTQEHLLVDLDICSWFKAQNIARMIAHDTPKFGDVLIVESSSSHYHLIFDDRAEWDDIVAEIINLHGVGIVEDNYRNVRKFRRDLTLRVSEKIGMQKTRPAPSPRLILQVLHDCNHFHGIKRYLDVLKAFNPTRYELIPKEVIS